MPPDPQALEDFSRGYDRGNYGGTYESMDWASWYTRQLETGPVYSNSEREGMLLGFYSSYEIHEIPESEANYVRELRETWKDE